MTLLGGSLREMVGSAFWGDSTLGCVGCGTGGGGGGAANLFKYEI